MKPSSRLSLALLLSFPFAQACRAGTPVEPSAAPVVEVQQWGTLRDALRDGRTEARVRVADVAQPGVYGVGAAAGLVGELTLVDGEVWLTEGDAERPRTSIGAAAVDAEATVLFAARVDGWQERAVTAPVDPSDLERFLAAEARAAGLDPGTTFPFVVEGELRHLRLHVIAGACPIRARMLGAEPDPPPYERTEDTVDGRLVGFWAPDAGGVVTHMGASTHVHAVLPGEQPLTGHVETVGLGPGARLLLPRR